MAYTMQYPSPLGPLTLTCDGQNLTGLWLKDQKYFGGSHPEELTPGGDSPVLLAARNWLDRYFSGARPSPRELPLAPQGSPFRQEVWKLLLEIPWGAMTTYGELARRLGRQPFSAQAVGGAVGHNPISIIIPCHRVVGANGSLTGYAGGLEAKEWLLRHEGAAWQ